MHGVPWAVPAGGISGRHAEGLQQGMSAQAKGASCAEPARARGVRGAGGGARAAATEARATAGGSAWGGARSRGDLLEVIDGLKRLRTSESRIRRARNKPDGVHPPRRVGEPQGVGYPCAIGTTDSIALGCGYGQPPYPVRQERSEPQRFLRPLGDQSVVSWSVLAPCAPQRGAPPSHSANSGKEVTTQRWQGAGSRCSSASRRRDLSGVLGAQAGGTDSENECRNSTIKGRDRPAVRLERWRTLVKTAR